MNFEIRYAKGTEALELSDLAARSKSYWPYEESYLELCRRVTHITQDDISKWPVIVAIMDERIIGFSVVCDVKGENMLDHLWIEPEFIGKGIGRALFFEALSHAKAMGWTKCLVASDPYAKEFYLKLGAKRIGKRESKVKPDFFLPLLQYDFELVLIGDKKIKDIPILDCGNPIVDLRQEYPQLMFDMDRNHVQKISQSISFARREVGEILMKAQSLLPSGIRLLIKECYRPMRIQKRFWDEYSQFLKTKYPNWSEAQVYDECSKLNAPLDVAPHTTGGAVDLTLINSDGRWLDMGTGFNASPLSTKDATFTAAENISPEARKNRLMLASAMCRAGFVNYPTEWWHWSYGDKYWAYILNKPHAIYASVENEPNSESKT